MILLKLKWFIWGIRRANNFSLLLLAKIKSEKLGEIRKYYVATSQMDKVAPENVSNNSGALKLDARREAQQAQF